MAIYTHYQVGSSPDSTWLDEMGNGYTFANASIINITNHDGTLTKAHGNFAVFQGIVLSGQITSLDRTSADGQTVYESITGFSESALTFLSQDRWTKFGTIFAGADQFYGWYGNDEFVGYGGKDLMVGGLGKDTMWAMDGEADKLIGGGGDDTYTIDAKDTVIEQPNEGVDLVYVDNDAPYTLPANVENVFTAIATEPATIYGNELDNDFTIYSYLGSFYGGEGWDTFTDTAGVQNHLYGGPGTDTYYVSTTSIVVELPGEGDHDTVQTTASTYTLPDNVETLVFNDTGSHAGTGNEGENFLSGNAGKDTFFGLGGNDILIGWGGGDLLYGGAGNDEYRLNVPEDAATQVIELPNEGIDTVKTSLKTYTLPDNVENLVTGGKGTIGIGNGLDNVMTAVGFGNAELHGLAGNDTLSSNADHALLDGGAGDDTAAFTGKHADYQISRLANGDLQVVDMRANSPDGTAEVRSIEHLAFKDGTVAVQPPSVYWSASTDIGTHPAAWQPSRVGDFNGDGTSDALWFNAATGNVDIWSVQNGQWAGSSDAGTHPAGWQPAAAGDFNGDGTDDILWLNPSTNNVDIWTMSNGHWAGSVDAGSHPAGYTVAGAGDFNNDGTSDVLWHNAATGDTEVWMLANGQWSASVDIGAHPLGWQPAGIGDFNNDGTSDVLWHNPATNDAEVWMISNGQWAGSINLGSHPAGWQPAAVGDFAHDGTSDILWYNPSTGDVDLWKITDGHWAGSENLGSHPGGWTPAGAGDFNHDGITDVLWGNAAGNHLETWLLGNG